MQVQPSKHRASPWRSGSKQSAQGLAKPYESHNSFSIKDSDIKFGCPSQGAPKVKKGRHSWKPGNDCPTDRLKLRHSKQLENPLHDHICLRLLSCFLGWRIQIGLGGTVSLSLSRFFLQWQRITVCSRPNLEHLPGVIRIRGQLRADRLTGNIAERKSLTCNLPSCGQSRGQTHCAGSPCDWKPQICAASTCSQKNANFQVRSCVHRA